MSGSYVLQGVDQFGRVFHKEEHLEVEAVQVAAQIVMLFVTGRLGERLSHQLKFHRRLNKSEALKIFQNISLK